LFINTSQLKKAIEIFYSMTNDSEYDTHPYCITGEPFFDEAYYLTPASPGIGLGKFGTNMGRIDSTVFQNRCILISEIMYNSSLNFDTKDWIELYNPQTTTVDISGWLLKDFEDDHIFSVPEGVFLSSQSCLVICKDSSSFKTHFPDVDNLIGNTDYGFGRGDQVRLYDSGGGLVDSVAYGITDLWPQDADGEGYSLELINVFNAVSQPENWQVSKTIGGTPGYKYVINAAVDTDADLLPEKFLLKQNYPNPFNSGTKIEFSFPVSAQISLNIYNILGQEVNTVIPRSMYDPGFYSYTFDGSALSSGIYIYKLFIQPLGGVGSVLTKKMVLLE